MEKIIEKIFEQCLKPIIKQPISVLIGSLFGAFGMLNLIDSLMTAHINKSWTIIPSGVRDLLLLFRAIVYPVYDFIFGWLHLKIPLILRDYFTMGIIVLFMRLRSTIEIAKEIKNGLKKKYKQRILNREIEVNTNSSRTTWFLFYLSRLSYAFLLWPVKLFGAVKRFTTGKLRPGTSKNQYIVFFLTIIYCLISLLIFAVIKAASKS